MTKLDVLDGLETVRVCTKYEGLDGQIASARFGSEYYSELSPSYEDLPGWQESTVGARDFKDFPTMRRHMFGALKRRWRLLLR